MKIEQVKKLAKFLSRKGLNGGRVARLLLGATAPQAGDYGLLMDAAFAASGSAAEDYVGVEDLYEILCHAAQRSPQ